MDRILYALTPPPDMRNVGDQAQAHCIHDWFRRHWPDTPVLEFHKKVPVADIVAEAREGDVVFLHSGGNMANRALALSERVRREIVRALFNHRIISLPQTISLTGKALRGAELVYNAHPNLTILARDPVSYGLALEHFEACDVGLCPDFVLGYDYEPRGTRLGTALLCLRHDKESAQSEADRQNIAEACRAVGLEPIFGDTSLPKGRKVPPELREPVLFGMLDEFAKHKLVITDRLHGVIFAVLARTPCVVLPTTDHKLAASWFWFRHVVDVEFAEGRELEQVLRGPWLGGVQRKTNWRGEWFDRLAGWIDGKTRRFALSDLMRSRRSVRRWRDQAVAELQLHRLIWRMLAPSGGNAQCVRFHVLTDPARIAALARTKGHGLADNHPPAVILVGYDYSVPGTLLHGKRRKRWLPLAYQDVAAAMQNMGLCAESEGLGACWVSVFDERAQAALPVWHGEWISALFVGFPDRPWLEPTAHSGRPIARRPLDDYLAEVDDA